LVFSVDSMCCEFDINISEKKLKVVFSERDIYLTDAAG
jgi:hypothetical protein